MDQNRGKTAPNSLGKRWIHRAENLCGGAYLFSLLNSYCTSEKLSERGEKLSDKRHELAVACTKLIEIRDSEDGSVKNDEIVFENGVKMGCSWGVTELTKL